jgi:hypothetical protein
MNLNLGPPHTNHNLVLFSIFRQMSRIFAELKSQIVHGQFKGAIETILKKTLSPLALLGHAHKIPGNLYWWYKCIFRSRSGRRL